MQVVIILLESGVLVMTDMILVLFTIKPARCCCLESSLLNQKPWPSCIVVSPHFLKCVSSSLMMNLSCAYVNLFSFPYWCKVQTFQVLTFMLCLGSLMCDAFHLFFLQTDASVNVVCGSEKGRFSFFFDVCRPSPEWRMVAPISSSSLSQTFSSRTTNLLSR